MARIEQRAGGQGRDEAGPPGRTDDDIESFDPDTFVQALFAEQGSD